MHRAAGLSGECAMGTHLVQSLEEQQRFVEHPGPGPTSQGYKAAYLT